MTEFTIAPDIINAYLNREIIRKMTVIVIIFTIIMGAMYVLMGSPVVRNLLLPGLIMINILIIIVFGFVTYGQTKNLITNTKFAIGQTHIVKQANRGNINLMNEIGMARNEFRFGTTYNQVIPVTDIESTQITSNGIVIKSKDYNLFSGNGKIVIPKEIENFEQAKEIVLHNPDLYKVLSAG